MKIHGAGKEDAGEDIIAKRLARLHEAYLAFCAALHELDGTQADAERYGTREMAVAGTHADTAYLWARQAIETQ
jgi:hypothetical protein